MMEKESERTLYSSRNSIPQKMLNRWLIVLFMVFSCFAGVSYGSAGDADPLYRSCVNNCISNGCIGEKCFPHCNITLNGDSLHSPWYMQEALYLKWKQSDCLGDCRYYCMIDREQKRQSLGHGPVKYHGKWPFKRVFGLQEPVSVALSIFNLLMHLRGWLSFYLLLRYKLPQKQNKTYYEYTTLWHIYGLLSINSWVWSAVFHSRDIDLTEKLDYSSAVAVLGYSLIVSIMRSFHVRDEAARVMVAAPLLAFITTHILYLNNYKMDYGWNMQVCVVMAVVQLLTWAIWAGVTHHPSRWKLWFVVVAGGFAMLLEVYDFPPYEGLVDAHALWHATTIPLTHLWWSFIKDDAKYRTTDLTRKIK
ncbi:uncharacterized protein LOC104892538 [Beta vulgaris subsp. vulgaris]|uniref:uncharacterized protein LOC104892538 n=1 Tax=Beta vulgaris subsp. vulgaris TaxID=3555 RepID=UPI002036B905|nr:uncharacterized protein LOC104892538 [Beta vulgaris subsp. vulgaris]